MLGFHEHAWGVSLSYRLLWRSEDSGVPGTPVRSRGAQRWEEAVSEPSAPLGLSFTHQVSRCSLGFAAW